MRVRLLFIVIGCLSGTVLGLLIDQSRYREQTNEANMKTTISPLNGPGMPVQYKLVPETCTVQVNWPAVSLLSSPPPIPPEAEWLYAILLAHIEKKETATIDALLVQVPADEANSLRDVLLLNLVAQTLVERGPIVPLPPQSDYMPVPTSHADERSGPTPAKDAPEPNLVLRTPAGPDYEKLTFASALVDKLQSPQFRALGWLRLVSFAQTHQWPDQETGFLAKADSEVKKVKALGIAPTFWSRFWNSVLDHIVWVLTVVVGGAVAIIVWAVEKYCGSYLTAAGAGHAKRNGLG